MRKVTRHTNDEYELFTRVHTSKCVVTSVLRYAAASGYDIIVTRLVSDLKM